ncbi:hypothetical protein C7974DRAFT_375851 [Boeremia exigua]|uniref:uncharacterized protein n=1 Tax=Boeremia exigua TaxID=749465 RepID=UPI001E8E3A23|nr:uncharacterized protein C7974DRAFT_375851 [Boeremia exigua]KAH6628952.1 hypothetical protein C7974DRAFT_375851 [Boeremia exigua]
MSQSDADQLSSLLCRGCPKLQPSVTAARNAKQARLHEINTLKNDLNETALLEQFFSRSFVTFGFSQSISAEMCLDPSIECKPLLAMMETAQLSSDSMRACREAIASLQWSFKLESAAIEPTDETRAVFAWPSLLSSAFMDLLSTRTPEALVILCFYGRLLHRHRKVWFVGDTGLRLVAGMFPRRPQQACLVDFSTTVGYGLPQSQPSSYAIQVPVKRTVYIQLYYDRSANRALIRFSSHRPPSIARHCPAKQRHCPSCIAQVRRLSHSVNRQVIQYRGAESTHRIVSTFPTSDLPRHSRDVVAPRSSGRYRHDKPLRPH